MSQFPSIAKIFLYGFAILVFVLTILFSWIAYGEPIHDINTWLLERNFYANKIMHPSGSALIEKKRYLGGPSLHGGNRCVYAVGETRIAPLSIKEIKLSYKDIHVAFWDNQLPLKVLFVDEFDGPYEMPFVDWQDKLRALPHSDSTAYIVYATDQRRIVLSDWRCDD